MKKLPTVAIIGQTNAGKSSLFNRISRSRRAIVAREEGTTRDNVMTRVEHAGASFWLVDTAGLKDPEDDFEATIQQQIEEASAAADLILVTTDSTKYPTQSDRDIAKKALKSGKPVILALNKVDLKDSLPRDEFLRLGIKNIMPVSAEHGTGVNNLLEQITVDIPKVKVTADENVLKIALIGRPNVGKSSLFNTLAKKQQAVVANLSGTTRDLNRVEIRYQGQAIEIIDTAGVRRPGKQAVGIEKFSVLRTMQAIEEADICLLLVDSNETHAQFDQKLAGIINEVGKGLVVVLTKWDTVDSTDIAKVDEIRAGISYDFKFVPFAPLVFTSSETGKNVAKLLDLALQIQDQREKEIRTSDLNRALRSAVAAHPPAGLKNTFPKLRYIVQTDTAPPWFVVYGSHLRHLHWSYKRYLERIMRDNFDFAGTPIKFSFREEKKERKK
jgi:GTP-binding protein